MRWKRLKTTELVVNSKEMSAMVWNWGEKPSFYQCQAEIGVNDEPNN